MISEMEQARHAEEKGAILLALKSDYSARMTSVRALLGALSLAGHSMRPQGLEFALVYLAEGEYVRIWRADEVPGWRQDLKPDLRPDQIMFAKLTNRGLQLIDGQVKADPGVAF